MIKKGQILSNYDIIDISTKLNLNINVICRDELINFKNISNKDKLKAYQISDKDYIIFIINLSNKNSIGSHWISLIINNKIAYYYDSFGRKPINEIKKYSRLNDYKLIYNKKIHQNIIDKCCGWFCLFHIITLINNKFNFNKTIKLLFEISGSNPLNLYSDNNDIIEIFFDKLFKIVKK